jgi:hypothetical protein
MERNFPKGRPIMLVGQGFSPHIYQMIQKVNNLSLPYKLNFIGDSIVFILDNDGLE